jgi:hypothetical protein
MDITIIIAATASTNMISKSVTPNMRDMRFIGQFLCLHDNYQLDYTFSIYESSLNQ